MCWGNFSFASLQVVDKDSEEAKIIKQYVKNTHAATHNAYDLKVVDVSWAVMRFIFGKMDSLLTCLFAIVLFLSNLPIFLCWRGDLLECFILIRIAKV